MARTAAQRSAVLLRNEGDLLPLTSPGSIAVIGPLADSRRDILGPWVFDFDLDETVTVLDGIRNRAARNRAGDGAEVRYAPGIRPAHRTFPSMFDMFAGNAPADPAGFDDDAELARAVTLAREADVALVVLGEWQNMIGEAASRSSLELPGGQLALLQAVAATGTPVVLLDMFGATRADRPDSTRRRTCPCGHAGAGGRRRAGRPRRVAEHDRRGSLPL